MNRFYAIAAALLAISLPAHAADFTAPIMQIDGSKPMHETTDEKSPVLTLATVAENALLASYQDEANLSGDEKIKRFLIAEKIAKDPKDPKLGLDELALIKKLVAKAYNPLITGDMWKALDPGSVAK